MPFAAAPRMLCTNHMIKPRVKFNLWQCSCTPNLSAGLLNCSHRCVFSIGRRTSVHDSFRPVLGEQLREIQRGCRVNATLGDAIQTQKAPQDSDKLIFDPVESYYPPDTLTAEAHVSGIDDYQSKYKASIEQPEAFWGEIATTDYHWNKSWDSELCRWNFDSSKGRVSAEWFVGAQTNLSYNCLDRHVEAGKGDRVAFYWEGNDAGLDGIVTYNQMLESVCKLANHLKSVGVSKGQDVTLYMPMIPELPQSMLACARLGAVHSVVFGGFSAQSLAERVIESGAKVIITCSALRRGPKVINLKAVVDEAVSVCAERGHTVSHVLVYDHSVYAKREEFAMEAGRDVWWQDVVPQQSSSCAVEWMDAEEPLFKLYTSGSTGKPKGLLHTTGGYMVGAGTTFKYVFDYKPDDVYMCTADCGWITGHSYVTYGPMLHGATQVLFEGTPMYPDPGRYWAVVQKYKVSIFYTAPTAIRLLLGQGDSYVKGYDLSSLRLLGTVGEPINHEAWKWYHEVVGGGRCPIMDTWWQTETGSHCITPLPGATKLKPGSATLPFFGVLPVIMDEQGNELEGEAEGLLMIKQAWPSMARTIAGDHQRYEATYFSMHKGYYFTGDGARRDKDGYFWILGRVDDVINVSGHRIGTAEVENALDEHQEVAESAVIGVEHPIKGQAIYAYVVAKQGHYPTDEPSRSAMRKELVAIVRRIIGPIASPDVIHFVPELPRTRSGKIMRRILRKIASKEEDSIGDTSTLHNPGVVQEIISTRGL